MAMPTGIPVAGSRSTRSAGTRRWRLPRRSSSHPPPSCSTRQRTGCTIEAAMVAAIGETR